MKGSERAGTRRAFVTGGTGFVGSHVVDELLAVGYDEVRCLVRTRLKWLEGRPIDAIRGDLHDREALRRGVEGVDYVFHVAAVTGTKWRTTWGTFHSENVTGTRNLLEAVAEVAPDVSKVVVTSSLAVIGPCSTGVADEHTPLHPISMYGRSKVEMEAEAGAWSDRLPIVVVRPPSVYGPREEDIYTFFRACARGLCPVVGGGAGPELSLVHGADLARGMRQAAEHADTAGKTYFLGGARDYSWSEVRSATVAATGRGTVTIRIPTGLVQPIGAVAEFAARAVGRNSPLNREKAREIRHACKRCSSARAMREFGYRPEIGLDEGIRTTIEWYREHGWL